MGLYAKYIFPHMLEYVMSSSILVDCRKDTLLDVKGEILEIGFGTGMNLLYYPAHVRKITGVDININIHSKAEKRLQLCTYCMVVYLDRGGFQPFFSLRVYVDVYINA